MNDARREELEAMYDADQSIRIEGMRIAQQHGPESPEFAALVDREDVLSLRRISLRSNSQSRFLCIFNRGVPRNVN